MARPRPVLNPPSPWALEHVDWEGPAPDVRLEIFEQEAKSIVTENRSPDVGFRYGVNPYRGCFHGCTYCYARPTHEYLDFGAGTDFDRKIVVKVNAPELLERRLSSRRWSGEAVVFSGNTDCYQPLEASYALTRRCLEVCLERRNPVGIITKGNVIRRDVELLARVHRRAPSRVFVSVAFADEAMRRAFDPFAPPALARIETIRRLAEAGIPVGVGLSPIIAGVNEPDIPEILERARDAGASTAFLTVLRLPRGTSEYFFARLREALSPAHARKVEHAIEELTRPRAGFGERMRGKGPRWRTIEQLFEAQVRRLGLEHRAIAAPEPKVIAEDAAPREAKPKRQLTLF